MRKAAAEHGGKGQGHEPGDQDGNPYGDRKFVEQPPENPSHEQQRDKDRHQRQGHGDDREANLSGTVKGGLHGPLPHLHMAHDVFQHDNGIVHHKTDGEGERHEGEIVQAVTEQIHDREGADNRSRQGQTGNNGGRKVPQEQENHQHDQADAEIGA